MELIQENVVFKEFLAYVTPFYQAKDPMHDLSHIERVLHRLEMLLPEDADRTAVYFAAYCHGLTAREMEQATDFLSAKLSQNMLEEVLLYTQDSHSKSTPQSLLGGVLHDAHLLEGENSFYIIKCLLTGAYRGQSVQESIQFMEEHILNKFQCSSPIAQKLYSEREEFAHHLLEELKDSLLIGR